MARIASQAGSTLIGGRIGGRIGGPDLPVPDLPVPDGMAARSRGQIEAMRRGGMSATAIRRALGLSAEEALAAGIVAPAGAGGGPARDRRPQGARAADSRAGAPRDAARSSQAGPAMTGVLRAVARISGVPPARLLGPGQERLLVRPRHLTMYLLRALCAGASLPAIGHFLGRDHTTVLYGCRRAGDLLARDPEFRRWRDEALSILAQDPDAGVPEPRPARR